VHNDECHSDETTLLNDEDWSSAGSTEEMQGADGTASAKATPKDRPGSAQGMPSGTSAGRKSKGLSPKPLGAKPPVGKASEAKASRPRGIKELNDAARLEPKGWGAASMLASIDFELIVALVARGGDAMKQRALSGHEALLRRTPRTRALMQARGSDRGVQAAMVVGVLVLLSFLQYLQQLAEPVLAQLPQALMSTHWLEIPIALVLGLRCSDLGSKLWAVCAPMPLPQSRCDRPSQSS